CENSATSPRVGVGVRPDAVDVQDNGPGVPAAVVKRSTDYAVRVSDKMYYVSPTRGQQGNAFKCLWAAPLVATGERGLVEVFTPPGRPRGGSAPRRDQGGAARARAQDGDTRRCKNRHPGTVALARHSKEDREAAGGPRRPAA